MEIQQLRGFVAVADHKSFTRAAAATYRSQPTISLQVKALEDELGVRLVRREPGKQLELTCEGEALYRLAVRLLEEVDSIKGRLENDAITTPRNSLKIMTDLMTVPSLLYEHIRAFKMKHPDCSLSVLSRNPHGFYESLASGAVDFGISTQRSFPADFAHETVYTFNRFLVAPKDHPLATDENLTLEKIAEHPLIVTNCGGAGRPVLEEIFARAGLELKVSIEVDHPENIKTYAQHGLGVAILNELFIRPDDLKNFWFRDVSQWFGQGEIALVYYKGRILTPRAREFCNMLLAEKEYLTESDTRKVG